jgi:hypothetical protein
LCSINLGKETGIAFFGIVGTMVLICVILLWFLVSVKTAIAVWVGDLYAGPGYDVWRPEAKSKENDGAS